MLKTAKQHGVCSLVCCHGTLAKVSARICMGGPIRNTKTDSHVVTVLCISCADTVLQDDSALAISVIFSQVCSRMCFNFRLAKDERRLRIEESGWESETERRFFRVAQSDNW